MTSEAHKVEYLNGRKYEREDALLTCSVIAPSLVVSHNSKESSLPVVKSISPRNKGDIVIPIKLVQRVYNTGVTDAELLNGEVRVRVTSTAGASNSQSFCHYCGDEIQLEDREQVILSSDRTNRSFHTDCYKKFLETLGETLQNNKTELAAYNI